VGNLAEREEQGRRMRRRGLRRWQTTGLSARSRMATARKVFPAASTGEAHALNGPPRMASPGLRESVDCEARWIYGGPTNPHALPSSSFISGQRDDYSPTTANEKAYPLLPLAGPRPPNIQRLL
jgi:hypothetical protein